MNAVLTPAPLERHAPFAEALVELGRRRDDLVVLSPDVSRWTDVVPYAEAYPDRFIQVGMAEQNLVGIAAGIAKSGLTPIAVAYACFLTRRAYDQIAMALATAPTAAVLVGFLPGITSPFRATHQAIDDVALMRVLPGTTVIDPADATELTAALTAAVSRTRERRGPVYLRALRGSVTQLFEPAGFDFEIGATRLLLDGDDAGLVTSGLGLQWALEATSLLETRGVAASVLHVPTLKPVDEGAIATFCSRFSVVTTIENHSIVGGLAAAVAEVVVRRGLGTQVRALGVPGTWGEHESLESIRLALALDAESISRVVLG